MSRMFDRLTPGEQRDIEQEGYDMKNERRQAMNCGDDVEVTFRGKIVRIEEDPWDSKNKRLMITIKNVKGDMVTVEEEMVSYAGQSKD